MTPETTTPKRLLNEWGEFRMKTTTKTNRTRRGAAVVEFAVCLPVLLILVLGSIECTSMIFLSQSLNVVAYEGARAAVKPDATTVDTLARCQEVIAERNLVNCQVRLEPGNIDDLPAGTIVTMTATAPCQPNGAIRLRFFSGSLDAQAFMVKE